MFELGLILWGIGYCFFWLAKGLGNEKWEKVFLSLALMGTTIMFYTQISNWK